MAQSATRRYSASIWESCGCLDGRNLGRGGTILAHNAWLPVLRTLGTRTWFGPRLMVSEANRVFGPGGELLDEKLRVQLQEFMRGFAEFI